MGVISNGTTLLDAGALDSGIATGEMTLITSTTLGSAAANITFNSGISSTYNSYLFKYINIHPQTDGKQFLINFRDGGTNFDATKTTTFFRAGHAESGGESYLGYRADSDLAQSTAGQRLGIFVGADNDQCCTGELKLFNPSSTTFVKHFIARTANNYYVNYMEDEYIAGYCNVTDAIDGVQFSMSSGNFDGVIKLYGVS